MQNRQGPDLSLQSELHQTLHSQIRHDGTVTDADTTNRVDHILTNLMSLAYCKAGLDPKAMIFLRKALQKHKYHPVTEHGISPLANEHTESTPFYGPGQGSSDRTNAWGLIHDKIEKVYSKKTPGRPFMDVQRMRSWGAKLGVFVDDVKLYHKGERTIQTVQL